MEEKRKRLREGLIYKEIKSKRSNAYFRVPTTIECVKKIVRTRP